MRGLEIGFRAQASKERRPKGERRCSDCDLSYSLNSLKGGI